MIVRVPRGDPDVEGLCLCICPLDRPSLHIWAMVHSVLLSLQTSDMDACVHVVCEMGMEINAIFPAKITNKILGFLGAILVHVIPFKDILPTLNSCALATLTKTRKIDIPPRKGVYSKTLLLTILFSHLASVRISVIYTR